MRFYSHQKGKRINWEDKYYENAGCFECRGEFSSPENKKIILDLFDTYCDVQEVLAEEGLKFPQGEL